MAVQIEETFLSYSVSLETRPLFQTLSSYSSPSPTKISFLFVRETFKVIRDPLGFFARIAADADDPSMRLFFTCFDAEEINRGNCEFYRSICESLKRIGTPDEDLATAIVESACEISESISKLNFRELVLKINIMVTDLVTTSDPSPGVENTASDAMEEYGMANNGMVPTSDEAKKKMLKSFIVTGEENLEGDDRSDGCQRERTSRDPINENTCAICLEEILVGSRATQVSCSHVFHNTCIEEWLEVSHFCPICRFEFPTD